MRRCWPSSGRWLPPASLRFMRHRRATTMTCGNQLECSDPTANCNNRREGTTKTIEWIPMDYHHGCWSMEASSLRKNINSPYETMAASMTTSATINSTERTRQCPKQQSTAATLRKRDEAGMQCALGSSGLFPQLSYQSQTNNLMKTKTTINYLDEPETLQRTYATINNPLSKRNNPTTEEEQQHNYKRRPDKTTKPNKTYDNL